MVTSFQEYRERLLGILVELAPRPDAPATDPFAGLAFTRPPKPEMGDLALPAFPLAKVLRQPPPATAARWAEAIRSELARPDGRLAGLAVSIRKVTTAGPYINLTLDPPALARLITGAVIERGDAYGSADRPSGRTVMVEYSSPNTNKPLHLGHIRNGLLGMGISNLLEAAGDRVIRTSLVNDRGIHICKSMLAYERWGTTEDGTPETPVSTGEKGDHFVGRYYVLFNTRLGEERAAYARAQGIDPERFRRDMMRAIADETERKAREDEAERFEKAFLEASQLQAEVGALLRRWEAGDPAVLELWRTMNGWVYDGFRTSYERLAFRFDKWYFESDTWQGGKAEVERGLREGIFYRKEDGSTWARLEPVGLQDKVLLRADGTTVYITQDLATAIHKFDEYHMDRSLYVVGAEQDVHFRNLFAILKLLGHEWADRCTHVSYSMVNLARGMGKLKSREGTRVDADNLLDALHAMARAKIIEGGHAEAPETIDVTAEQIGQGALKLYILQVSPDKTIVFDPEATIAFTGDTGPAVQYSHARIHGIVRKGLTGGKLAPEDLGDERFLRAERADTGLLIEPEERDVLRLLAEFPDTVAAAARQLSPAPVANALLDLTKAYARMYHQHEVLKAEPPLMRARLQLALCTARVLRNGLRLLTIEAPERM